MIFDAEQLRIHKTELAPNDALPEAFAYAAIRRAGVSARVLQRLEFDDALSLLDRWIELKQTNAAERQNALDALERVIGRVERGPSRVELIHLKRDVFNDRPPRIAIYDLAMQELKSDRHVEESSAIAIWITTKETLDRLWENLEEVFAREFAHKDARLRAICRKKEFRRGLEYSSPALSQDVAKYLESPQSFSVAKRARIQRSIIRYYARSALKLSPFSAFMRTRVVRLSWGAQVLRHKHRVSIGKHVALNRTFIAQLAHSLVLHPELCRYVPIWANASIVQAEDRVLLMRHEYKERWTKRLRIPSESFIELQRHAIFPRVLEVLRTLGPCVLPHDLIEALAEELGGKERASSLIKTLIEMHILKHRVPLPEDDTSAVRSLLNFLESVSDRDTRFASLVAELEQLERLEESLREAAPEEVPSFLNQIHAAGARAHAAIGDTSAPDWTGHLIFDNSVEEPVGHLAIAEHWQTAREDLREFLGAFVPLLDLNSCVRESMRYVLEREFQGKPVPFLQFAQRYGKALKSCGRGADSEFGLNPFGLGSLRELETIWREIGTMFLGEADGEDFDLRSANKKMRWTERFRKLGLARPVEGKIPVTCFVQPCYLDDDRPGLVVNSIGAGPCGAVLRACCGLRDRETRTAVTSELSQEIAKTWSTAQPCELRATFDFNPNLSPSVTKRCINYMSDPSAAEHGIGLGSIVIELSEHGDLRLTNEGQELVPVGFGALGRQLHPPVARLLLALGGAEPVAYNRMSGRDANAMGGISDKPVWFSPRFTYGSCVIRRRGWYFAPEYLPADSRKGGALGCFSAVRKWQHNWNLPDEVFVQPRSGGSQGAPRPHDVRSFVSRKPQYINFRNYFLTESFVDLVADRENGVFCEEALPNPAQWMQMGTGRPMEIAIDMCLNSSLRGERQMHTPQSTKETGHQDERRSRI